jgi:hypothetical protein
MYIHKKKGIDMSPSIYHSNKASIIISSKAYLHLLDLSQSVLVFNIS